MKLSFIGTGNMGGAIVRAVCTTSDPTTVYLSNRSPAKAEALAESCGCHVSSSNADCVRDANYIFLGVKPNQIRDLLRELAPALNKQQVIVSMAAGITGDAMRAALGKENPIVRILPNTPSAIGKGLVHIVPCGEVAPEILTELQTLLAPCGMTAFTDEAHADAATVIGGCVPAFTYMYIEALADSAVLNGLPRADAMAWAAQAVAGAAELLLATKTHPGALKDAVCSPGGSTLAGIHSLETAAFRGAVMDAVSASCQKNRELGK